MVILSIQYYYQLVNIANSNKPTLIGMKEKPEKIRRILAQNIKKRREYLGFTQEQLAEMTELSVQTINTIEGCRMWISDKSITRLAKALKVEIFQLFMPNRIDLNKFDAKENAVLLEFWQKTKLVVGKIDSQIDNEFKEVLQNVKQLEEKEPQKPVRNTPGRRR
jgi:transcriptional regulator with XRE-family HTH domain